jgi:exodeoxyribonuclease VII small subunit
MSIEKTLQRLDEIMNELESNDKELKEVLLLYEEGMNLIKQSKSMIEEAELKVKQFQDKEIVDFNEKNDD